MKPEPLSDFDAIMLKKRMLIESVITSTIGKIKGYTAKVLRDEFAEFSHAISQCERWWKLTRRKWKRIRKVDNQVNDALHKHTTKFVDLCQKRGIGTIVLGDLTGIRENINYGKRANQKLHQWAFGKVTQLITYKAKVLGIKVEQIDEAYTSQTCRKCGNRKKPTNRNYTCGCRFKYHSDGVGAINIKQKYLGRLGDPVVAAMAPPLGFRLEVPVALGLNPENVPT